jgi:hypothetical protein
MSTFRGDIAIENMIYGVLPDRRMGQEVLGKTPGIPPDTEQEIVEFCTSWGDCRNLKFRRSLNQFPLKCNSPDGDRLIAVIKVINSGLDSIGREGALVRHALVLRESDYRHLEFNPFTLESLGVFLTVWTKQSNCEVIFLDSRLVPPSDFSEIPRAYYDSLFSYLHTLLSGGEIFLFLNNHLHTAEDIIYYVIKLLPVDFRSRIALTTFAFRKNLDYSIGCYYRQSGAPADPLKIRFEMAGEKDEKLVAFLKALFENLECEKYGRAARMLFEPLGV